MIYINMNQLNFKIFSAVDVLKNPTRIYVGLKRILSNSGLCFVGKPNKWYIREDKLVDFPKDDLVYTVFLNDRFSVFEIRATKVDFLDLMPNWLGREEFEGGAL